MSDRSAPGTGTEITADRQRILRLEARVSELEARTSCLAEPATGDDAAEPALRPVLRMIRGGRA